MFSTLSVSAILSVSCGGAIGAALRYICAVMMNREIFPFGTVAVNIAGSFVMGAFAAWLLSRPENTVQAENIRLFLAVGLLGGFTTFSAFSLETMKMFQTGFSALGVSYVALSVFGSLAAVFLGYAVMRGAG
ncbi:MAG: fluoride efflux transporter CrcB [Pseudomonadota bacterium]|nr:fluoride efflux transporter CrcB [Pseudomonadota bacterium]QKK04535.1 MAG: fluoride efflux transporter CrcB [Pseudomonadota bacterium]